MPLRVVLVVSEPLEYMNIEGNVLDNRFPSSLVCSIDGCYLIVIEIRVEITSGLVIVPDELQELDRRHLYYQFVEICPCVFRESVPELSHFIGNFKYLSILSTVQVLRLELATILAYGYRFEHLNFL